MRKASSSNDTSFGWKDAVQIVLSGALYGIGLGIVTRLGPVQWWQRYAAYAIMWALLAGTGAVISWALRRRPVPPSVFPFALLIGVVGGALQLVWWGLPVAVIAILVVVFAISAGKTNEDAGPQTAGSKGC